MLSNILCFLVSLVLKWHIYNHLHIKAWQVTISLLSSHQCPTQLELWQAATPEAGPQHWKHSVLWQMAEECSKFCPQLSHKCREKPLGYVKHTNRSPLHASTPLRNIGHYVSMSVIKTGRMDNREKNTRKPPKRNLLTKQKKEEKSLLSWYNFQFLLIEPKFLISPTTTAQWLWNSEIKKQPATVIF